MKIITSYNLKDNTNLFLCLILLAFLLKGVFLATAFPIFSGQDESRHYNTVQFLSEPKEKNWKMEKQINNNQEKDDISTYRYSEEIKQTSLATNTDILRGEMFNTIIFSNNFTGANENLINQKPWQPINKLFPPDMVYETQLYHQIGSLIEKAFSNQSILIRFYLIRILSVAFGMFIVLLTYLIASNVGFSTKHGLILALIVSFQPKLTTYFTNINYDVLFILMFILFTYAGVLILKKGLNWKNLFLLFFSITIAILTKKTGSVLLIAAAILLASLFYGKFKHANKKIQSFVYGLMVFAIVIILLYLDKYLPKTVTFSSVSNYLSKSLSIGRFALSSRTYWGSLSWVDNPILDQITNIIWFIQAFAVAGIGIYFFSKKPLPSHLPEKKYVVFFMGMIIALQLGIRIADWSIYSQTGSLDLGTPGRYFLPNIVAHMILVFTGLGMFFEWLASKYKKVKSEYLFESSLKFSSILMMTLTMYIIFNEVIYRYYL